MAAAASYLESLNPEQRRAVEHGAAGPGPFAPLLVIAGAGSGKTNTLAQLRGIPGIGDKKLEHYGDELIALVKAEQG